MILRPALRISNGLCQASSCLRSHRIHPTDAPFRRSLQHQQQQNRNTHSVPSLGSQDEQYKAEGIPGLFSADGFNTAWTQYQTYVVQRLNDTLAINGDKRLGPTWNTKTILLSSARDPAQASIFNYASMAHNNHFFFQTLTAEPTEPAPEFQTHIKRSFSSLETFKTEMLATAASMFGPGFVWLVQHRNPSPTHPAVPLTYSESSSARYVHLRLLVTYLAGSPYPGAHNRQQGQDMNVQNIMSTAEEYDRLVYPQNSVGSFGPYGGRAQPPPSPTSAAANSPTLQGAATEKPLFAGADIVPLLCVNTWQHCFLPDYGVAGKDAYLENWWKSVDWDAVWARADRIGSAGGGFRR